MFENQMILCFVYELFFLLSTVVAVVVYLKNKNWFIKLCGFNKYNLFIFIKIKKNQEYTFFLLLIQLIQGKIVKLKDVLITFRTKVKIYFFINSNEPSL